MGDGRQFLKNRFCRLKMWGDREIPLKIALVAGGLMVYTKEDKKDSKYSLCFGIPEANGIQDFWFSISAQTG